MSTKRRKSILTAYSRILSMIVSIISQFVLTPIILSILGSTLYGIYTLLNKTNNYLSIVDLRPTAVLRLKLAHDQENENIQEKKKYIGASLFISLVFTPVFLLGGFFLAYWFPYWFHVDAHYVTESRIAIVLLSLFLALNGFMGIPEAILRGNNLEYKGFFVEPIRLILVAVLTILFLYIGWGLLSVVIAMFIAALFSFVSRAILRVKYLRDYSICKPQRRHIKEFFSSGSWYLVSSFVTQVINNFDVILIGVLIGPKEVAVFAVTKAIVFRLIESLQTIISSSTSSVGAIVGNSRHDDVFQLRVFFYRMIIPLSLCITSYFVLFNGSFINLWTGSDVFAGEDVNFVICLSAFFLMLTSIEEIFILSSLDFKTKSLYLLISAIVSVIISLILTNSFGLLGNAIGIFSGRILLFFLYYLYNNKKIGYLFNVDVLFVFKVFIFFILVVLFKTLLLEQDYLNLSNFVLYSAIFVLFFGLFTFFFLLDDSGRKTLCNLIVK